VELNHGKQRLDKKIDEKCKEAYVSVMNYIRAKIKLALLRSSLAVVSGFQGKQNNLQI